MKTKTKKSVVSPLESVTSSAVEPPAVITPESYMAKRAAADAKRKTDLKLEYARLVALLAGNKLPADQSNELNGVADKLNFDAGQIAADVSTFQNATNLEEHGQMVPELDAELAAAVASQETIERESLEEIQAIEKRRIAAQLRREDISRRAAAARRARADLDTLRRQNHELFCCESKEQHSQKTHLCQTVFARPSSSACTVDCREFEQVMASPGVFQPDKIYISIEGQTDEQLTELVSRCSALQTAWKAGKKGEGRYLTLRSKGERFANSDRVIFLDDPADCTLQVDAVAWELLPGQTQENLDALLVQLKRKVTIERDRRFSNAAFGGHAVERSGGVTYKIGY